MAIIIDPPSGWKYGFPKSIPEDRIKDAKNWLIENGYPQSEMDSYGEYFHYRVWEAPEKNIPAGDSNIATNTFKHMTIEFDNGKLNSFRNDYTKAVKENKKSFIFENNEFLTSYAKSLIEYVEGQISTKTK